MKNKHKILPKIVIIILIVTLISVLVLSSVYAKYVSVNDPVLSEARPAAFELVMEPITQADEIEVNFASDGEPGSPIGYTEVYRNYDFYVKTSNSEVAADYWLTITFDKKVADMIRQGRRDKYSDDSISCDFEILRKTDSGYEAVSGVESGSEELVWRHSATLEPGKNPDGTADGKVEYRLRMIIYNNTTMPATGNTSKFVFVTNGINIEVSSKQIDPQFAGTYTVN